MSNNMETYATKYIQEHKILEEGEKIIAYYDVTLALDGTEAAMVTNKRVIYHKGGNNTAIKLAEIESIDHKDEFGLHITVVDKEGQRMGIEVAPLNGGPEFLSALEDGHRRALKKQEAPTP